MRKASESPYPTLDHLARQSRRALQEGSRFYTVESTGRGIPHFVAGRLYDPAVFNLTTIVERGIHRVLAPIPVRGFSIDRSLDSYGRKLGINPLDFIRHTTEGEGPHLVIDAGAGLGRAMQQARRGIKYDPDLRGRGISLFTECDQIYFKYTTVLRNLLTAQWNRLAREELNLQDQRNSLLPFRKEFVKALVLFLMRQDDFSVRFDDPELAVLKFGEESTWQGLCEWIEHGGIVGFENELDPRPYQPSPEMMNIFRHFEGNPRVFLRHQYQGGGIFRRADKNFGIAFQPTILGGDMRDAVEFIPDGSLSAMFGVRSTVYLAEAKEPGRDDSVTFMMKLARKLRPGGGVVDDWPRRHYDVGYYFREVAALHRALQDDPELRKEIELYLIWGQSEEFPIERPFAPLSLVMLRKNSSGISAAAAIEKSLIAPLRIGDSAGEHPYQMIPVDGDEEVFGQNRILQNEDMSARQIMERKLMDVLAGIRERSRRVMPSEGK